MLFWCCYSQPLICSFFLEAILHRYLLRLIFESSECQCELAAQPFVLESLGLLIRWLLLWTACMRKGTWELLVQLVTWMSSSSSMLRASAYALDSKEGSLCLHPCSCWFFHYRSMGLQRSFWLYLQIDFCSAYIHSAAMPESMVVRTKGF